MHYVQQGLCGWRNITASHTCADLHCGIEIIMSKYNYLANLINVWGSENSTQFYKLRSDKCGSTHSMVPSNIKVCRMFWNVTGWLWRKKNNKFLQILGTDMFTVTHTLMFFLWLSNFVKIIFFPKSPIAWISRLSSWIINKFF